MMRVFSLARMQITFVHHTFESIHMGAAIFMVLHIPRKTMARLMTNVIFSGMILF